MIKKNKLAFLLSAVLTVVYCIDSFGEQNNEDASAELTQAWSKAGERYQVQKRRLIEENKIPIDRHPIPLPSAHSSPTSWTLIPEDADKCKASIDIPKSTGNGSENVRPACWTAGPGTDGGVRTIDWLRTLCKTQEGPSLAEPARAAKIEA